MSVKTATWTAWTPPTGKTITGYKIYSDQDGELASVGLVLTTPITLSDGVSHNVTCRAVYNDASLGLVSNVEVVDLSSQYLLDAYSNPAAAYSFRKLKSTAVNSIKIRRSSDNATTDVLLDDTGSITLSSIVSAGGTLGTWMGASTSYIDTWYDQSGNGFDLVQATTGSQPKISSGGVLEVKGGLTGALFNGSGHKFEKGSALTALNDGNSFSIFTTAANIAVETIGAILSTTTTLSDRFVVFKDSRLTGKRNVVISETGTAENYDMSVGRSNTNQVLQSFHTNGTLRSGFDNGAAGVSNSVDNGSYTNDDFRVGVQLAASTFFSGILQEIIIFSTDKTSDRVAIEANINSYYTIF